MSALPTTEELIEVRREGGRLLDAKVKELATEFARFLREDFGFQVDGPPMYSLESRTEDFETGPLGGAMVRCFQSRGGIKITIDVPVTRRGII